MGDTYEWQAPLRSGYVWEAWLSEGMLREDGSAAVRGSQWIAGTAAQQDDSAPRARLVSGCMADLGGGR